MIRIRAAGTHVRPTGARTENMAVSSVRKTATSELPLLRQPGCQVRHLTRSFASPPHDGFAFIGWGRSASYLVTGVPPIQARENPADTKVNYLHLTTGNTLVSRNQVFDYVTTSN